MTFAKWWETTWAKVQPGDEVLAPDSSAWRVGSMLNFNGATSVELSNGISTLWSERCSDGEVQARRSPRPSTRSQAEWVAWFNAAGLDVKEVEDVPFVKGSELTWVRCGKTGRCICR